MSPGSGPDETQAGTGRVRRGASGVRLGIDRRWGATGIREDWLQDRKDEAKMGAGTRKAVWHMMETLWLAGMVGPERMATGLRVVRSMQRLDADYTREIASTGRGATSGEILGQGF